MTTVGIDTLRVAFAIDRCRSVEPAVENVDNTRGQTWLKWNLDGGGSIGVANGMAWVEASLARRTLGDNCSALPFRDLSAALVDLFDEVDQYVEFDPMAVALDRLRVPRVDLVRDFESVGNPSLLLGGLARRRQPGRAQVMQHSCRGLTQSVTVATKTSWTATAYDKHIESGGVAPNGRLRFEARLRTRRLQRAWAASNGGCIRVAADMTEEKITMLAKATFDVVGFGDTVTTREEVARRVTASDLPGHDQVVLIGHLLLQAVGASSPLSEGSFAKYERIARRLGVRLHPDALPAGMRLDWDTGREVLETG